MMRTVLWSVLSAAVLTALVGFSPSDPPATGPATVYLQIDYGDGSERHYPALTWAQGMTVLAALEQADRHPRGIELETKDYGTQGRLVVRVDDLRNQGSGKPNWLFWVNTDFGKAACDKTPLRPGDRVVWRFTKEKPKF